MSAIFGLVRFDGAPLDPQQLSRMAAASAPWGPDGQAVCQMRGAGLGCLRLAATPEALHERQPRQMPNGAWLASAARLDDRPDLCRALAGARRRAAHPGRWRPDRARLPALGRGLRRAPAGRLVVCRLGRAGPPSLPDRDPYGTTALYYHAGDHFFAFATSRKALLALDPALAEIDDLFVAQVLLVWPLYHGERTAHARLRRLPPAHDLAATPRASPPSSTGACSPRRSCPFAHWPRPPRVCALSSTTRCAPVCAVAGRWRSCSAAA